MGPPTISPRSLRVRYATESVTSQNLMTMPASAESHSQKIEPGPPVATASATPTMLPVPSVRRERGAHRLEGRDGALPRLGRAPALEERLGGVAHDHVEAREHDAPGDGEQECAGPEHQHDHGDAPQHVVVQRGNGGHEEVEHEGPSLRGAGSLSYTKGNFALPVFP